jgi:hypothetical protein
MEVGLPQAKELPEVREAAMIRTKYLQREHGIYII